MTNDSGLADRARGLRNLCFQPDKRFVHEELGWNYRLSNVHAAIGVAQLESLERHIALKKKMGRRYREMLLDIPGLKLPPLDQDYADNIYWVFGIVLDENYDVDAQAVMEQLAEEGVGSRPFFWPIHEQPVFSGKRNDNKLSDSLSISLSIGAQPLREESDFGLFKNEKYPVAENFARRGLYLPGGLALTEVQQERVVEVLRNVLEKHWVDD